MTAQPPKNGRAQKQGNYFVKKRTFQGALGGILGAIGMSVIAGILLTAAVTPVVALSGSAARTAISVFDSLPDNLNPGELAEPSTLYAKGPDGKPQKFAQFYLQDRVPVKWDQISQYAKDALVGTEDPRFYTHSGVDMISMSRALMQQVTGTGDSGASTITMQYVRNVRIQEAEAIMDPKEQKAAYKEATRQDADRKLQEMRYAVSIEKKFSKDEIMLGYMNIALFGRQIYGIESAANYYYGVKAKDLTIAQAASIMGIVKNPSKLGLDVEENLPANLERRNHLIDNMLKHGKITEAQHEQAINEPLEPKITPKVQGCEAAGNLGHFCNYVMLYIQNDPSFGNTQQERIWNLQRGGYDIMTTIDLDMQNAGVEAMQNNVPATIPDLDVGGASVSVEVGTGKVRGMVQNRAYSQDDNKLFNDPGLTAINYNTEFDYGGSSGFQVGSTYKAFTLAEWIRTDHSVRDIVNVNGRTVMQQDFRDRCKPDGVYDYGPFEFKNDNLGVRGNQTVLTATAQSLNGGFISMAQKMDLCDITKLATDMGVKRATGEPLTGNLASVFAGTDEIAPITMASAYAGFAGDGKVCSPVPLESITDGDGEKVAFTGSSCSQAIEPRVAAGVAFALEYTTGSAGLAGHARSAYGVPHLAKTGTTDNVVDNWTVGASTKVATATWVGNVTGKVSTQYVGNLMAAGKDIWPAMMNVADEKYGGDAFPQPDQASMQVKTTPVPETAGKSPEDARALLQNAGFTVSIGGETDSTQKKGTVARTNPGAGSNAQSNSDITIEISNGELTKIPDGLTGKSYQDARGDLAGAGFTKVNATCAGDGKLPGDHDKLSVESVSPGSGDDVKRDNQVTLSLKCK